VNNACCSADRPWGVHPRLRSDEACPRCGWTAPGPLGDAREAAAEALAAARRGWSRRDALAAA
jgi:hypothetical protein